MRRLRDAEQTVQQTQQLNSDLTLEISQLRSEISVLQSAAAASTQQQQKKPSPAGKGVSAVKSAREEELERLMKSLSEEVARLRAEKASPGVR